MFKYQDGRKFTLARLFAPFALRACTRVPAALPQLAILWFSRDVWALATYQSSTIYIPLFDSSLFVGMNGVPEVTNQVALGQRTNLTLCCSRSLPTSFDPMAANADPPRWLPPCTCTPANLVPRHICKPVVPACPMNSGQTSACHNRMRLRVPNELARELQRLVPRVESRSRGRTGEWERGRRGISNN